MPDIKKKMINFVTSDDVFHALDSGYSLQDKVSYTSSKTGSKAKRMSLGRVWFNIILPDKLGLIDEPVNAPKMNEILRDMVDLYEPNELCDIMTTFQNEIFKMTTRTPSSFSIDALILPDSIKELKEDFQKRADTLTPSEYSKEVKDISNKIAKELQIKDERVVDIISSKVKGVDNWDALMISQGYATDIEGNSVGPIKDSIVDGYNVKEFYDAAAEARRGFYYKAAISAEPGYLSRRVTMACAGIKLISTPKDCGTTKTFNLLITDALAKIIKGRTYIDGRSKKIIENPKELIGQTIKLRSPLYCKSPKGICPTCYGQLSETLKTKNIGILAGGVVNNAALNAYMKMRHKSSVSESIPVDFIEVLKKYNMNTPEFNKNFLVEKTKLFANKECYVDLNSSEYSGELYMEAKDHFAVPGILSIYINEAPDIKEISLPFNFSVRLNKPLEIEEDGKIKRLLYTPGEKILEQEFYDKDVDVSLMVKMLDGQTKYMTNPQLLVIALQEQMSNRDLVHFEIIVQNMFRDTEDPSIPARLTGYKSFKIYGQKALPFVTSWLTSLSFENPKKAIRTGLLTGRDSEMNPLEKIVSEQYGEEL